MYMGTARLDNFTDAAWLLVAAVTIIIAMQRVLCTLEELLVKSHVNISNSTRAIHAAIMVLVSIAAATIALPDEWIKSIVSALFVGIGFALKEVLETVMHGVSIGTRYENNKQQEIKIEKEIPSTFIIQKQHLLYCVIKAQGKEYCVSWNRLSGLIMQAPTKDQSTDQSSIENVINELQLKN